LLEFIDNGKKMAPEARIFLWIGVGRLRGMTEEVVCLNVAVVVTIQVQKKKIWESIQPLLKTTDDCAAVFQDKPMRAATGIVTCESLKGGNVS
jgi:hypothetical protein